MTVGMRDIATGTSTQSVREWMLGGLVVAFLVGATCRPSLASEAATGPPRQEANAPAAEPQAEESPAPPAVPTDELVQACIDKVLKVEAFTRVDRKRALLELSRYEPTPEQAGRLLGPLVEALRERSLRAAAAEVLARLGEPVVAPLSQIAADEEELWQVRVQTVQVLGRIARTLPTERADAITRDLIRLTQTDDPRVQSTVAIALAFCPEAALDGLCEALAADDPAQRKGAAGAVVALLDRAPEGFSDDGFRRLLEPLEASLQVPADDDPQWGPPPVGLRALDQLLARLAKNDPKYAERRVALLLRTTAGKGNDVGHYAAATLPTACDRLPADYFYAEALQEDRPRSLRRLAGKVIAERGRDFALTQADIAAARPSIQAALARESDPEAEAMLTWAAEVLQVLDAGQQRSRAFRLLLGYLVLLGAGGAATPFLWEHWKRHRTMVRSRRAANTEAIQTAFGLSDEDLLSAPYAAVRRSLSNLRLTADEAGVTELDQLLQALETGCALHQQERTGMYASKSALVQAIVDRLQGDAGPLAPPSPLLALILPDGSTLGLATTELDEVSTQSKADLSILLVRNEFDERQGSLLGLVQTLSKQWSTSGNEFDGLDGQTKVSFLVAGLCTLEQEEGIYDVLRRLTELFPFATNGAVSLLDTASKARLATLASRQDKGLQQFEDAVTELVLRPLRMGQLKRLAQLLAPTKEAEDEMFVVYADIIREVMQNADERRLAIDELDRKGKEHVVNEVFDLDDPDVLRLETRDNIADLMKTEPINRVMRMRSDDNREQRRRIEEQRTRDTLLMLIDLLEVAAAPEEARLFFKSRLESKLTQQDRDTFEIGGLPARRLRELVRSSAQATQRAMQ